MSGIGRIIAGDACVAEGAAWLALREPRFGQALARCGPLPLRRQPEGFDRLLQAIVGQQVSLASASAIWGRMQAAGLVREEAVAAAPDEALRAAGLSRQKMRYARALAAARIDYGALRALPDGQVVARLTQVAGIGAWTAEIYAMFSLGRADVLAAGDLALQEAARDLFGLSARPTTGELAQMAQGWSPWRAVAARILWAHYRVIKAREGVV